MILHKLILHYLKHGCDLGFYQMQAQAAIHWLEKQGIQFDSASRVLDLGCGHGIFGWQLLMRGCRVIFADQINSLHPAVAKESFVSINIDQEDISVLGRFHVVVCSNVLEHLSNPKKLIQNLGFLLKSKGFAYLSWTNWLSPWGGHEFSPFHFWGTKRGHLIYDKLVKQKRKHTPYQNLFPTHIGQILRLIPQQPDLKIRHAVPRYYPELAFVLRIPWLREFLTWNCAVLIERHQSLPQQHHPNPKVTTTIG